MTVMNYVARFTELAQFVDDYVPTDMVKVRRFENGLNLSIRAKIVGLRLRDMDSMVGTAQSQSVVGQEWIQYVPPQPGTSQRSQFQFQGAARAPPVTQLTPHRM